MARSIKIKFSFQLKCSKQFQFYKWEILDQFIKINHNHDFFYNFHNY